MAEISTISSQREKSKQRQVAPAMLIKGRQAEMLLKTQQNGFNKVQIEMPNARNGQMVSSATGMRPE